MACAEAVGLFAKRPLGHIKAALGERADPLCRRPAFFEDHGESLSRHAHLSRFPARSSLTRDTQGVGCWVMLVSGIPLPLLIIRGCQGGSLGRIPCGNHALAYGRAGDRLVCCRRFDRSRGRKPAVVPVEHNENDGAMLIVAERAVLVREHWGDLFAKLKR